MEEEAIDAMRGKYYRDMHNAVKRGAVADLGPTRELISRWHGPLAAEIRRNQELVRETGVFGVLCGAFWALRVCPVMLCINPPLSGLNRAGNRGWPRRRLLKFPNPMDMQSLLEPCQLGAYQ